MGSLLLVLVAAGCEQPENQDDDTPAEEECVEHTTVIGPSDDPGLGFTAEDLLANVAGNYADTLHWSATEGPAYYATPDTSVPLTIDVGFDGGEVRYVERTPQGWCDGACADYCESSLEIDATLALATADGELDESWSAVLTSRSATEASFYVTFDPDQTQGTLSSASFVITGGSIDTLIASGSVSDGTMSGSIAVQIALQGEGGGYGVFEVGVWPPL